MEWLNICFDGRLKTELVCFHFVVFFSFFSIMNALHIYLLDIYSNCVFFLSSSLLSLGNNLSVALVSDQWSLWPYVKRFYDHRSEMNKLIWIEKDSTKWKWKFPNKKLRPIFRNKVKMPLVFVERNSLMERISETRELEWILFSLNECPPGRLVEATFWYLFRSIASEFHLS